MCTMSIKRANVVGVVAKVAKCSIRREEMNNHQWPTMQEVEAIPVRKRAKRAQQNAARS